MTKRPLTRSEQIKEGLARAVRAGKKLGKKPNASDDQIRTLVLGGHTQDFIRKTLRVRYQRVADIKKQLEK